jgi:hypothetical protein
MVTIVPRHEVVGNPAVRPRRLALAELDWDVIWDAATDTERRTLLDEFLVRLDVFPDHLEVDIRGAGKLNVALHEVGLRSRSVEITGVGGATPQTTTRAAPPEGPGRKCLARFSRWLIAADIR